MAKNVQRPVTALERADNAQLLQQNATLLQAQNTVAPSRTFHVMPDLTKSIGDFHGRETPVEAKRWLKQIETGTLKNRRQRENECVQDYYHDNVRMCMSLELKFEKNS